MRRTSLLLALALLATAALAACDDEGDGGGAGADDRPEVCTRYDDFRDSLGDVTSLDTLRGGRDGIDDALDDARTDLDELREAAGQDFEQEIDALQDAFADARTSIADLGGSGSFVDRLSDVTDALRGVVSAADDLRDAIADKCDRQVSMPARPAPATGLAAAPAR